MKQHYLVQMKQNKINYILAVIKKVKKANLKILKQECYVKLGISPTLTMNYLKELEEVGFVVIDEASNTVEAL